MGYGALGAWFYIDATSGPAADEGAEEGGAPDPFQASDTRRWVFPERDEDGKLHGDLPDAINNWTLGQLRAAAFELCQSIRAREKDAEDWGGYDRNHAKRVNQEAALLKRILAAIRAYDGVE